MPIKKHTKNKYNNMKRAANEKNMLQKKKKLGYDIACRGS